MYYVNLKQCPMCGRTKFEETRYVNGKSLFTYGIKCKCGNEVREVAIYRHLAQIKAYSVWNKQADKAEQARLEIARLTKGA